MGWKRKEKVKGRYYCCYNTVPKKVAPISGSIWTEYAVGPCTTSLITGHYETIVIELAELLSEWWFPLSTNLSRADQLNTRRLGYTVRSGIEPRVK